MTFAFHEDAEAEFNEALDYYEERRPGLGLEFAQEVHAAISRVLQFPEAWPPISLNTRRCLVNRFPFGIISQVKSDALVVVAVAHLHLRPGFWRDRV